MTNPDSLRNCVAPFTAEDALLIQQELAFLIATPQFSGSKRYPAFLKWVVERTVAGYASELKERTIGVELFGKIPDYDTSNDTVVRFTAGEVRKRLVLAYHQPERVPFIQIRLPAGSYIPEFLRTDPHPVSQAVVHEPSVPFPTPSAIGLEVEEELVASALPAARPLNWRLGAFALVAATLLFAAFSAVRVYAARNDSALNNFWQPVRASGASVIIATGAVIPSKENNFGLTPATSKDSYPYVSLASASTVAHIGGLLEQKQIGYTVESSSRLALQDMLHHPVVLVGTFNNEWTLRALSNLRFGVTNKHEPGIVDTQNPGHVWRPSWIQGVRQNDYAIVARYHDKMTENTVVLVAGLEKSGTAAAADFVTDRRYLDLLDRTQPKGWSSKNIEIVVRAKVVDGQSGAPEVVAVHTW